VGLSIRTAALETTDSLQVISSLYCMCTFNISLIIIIIRNELTVVHPSRKNGEVTKSQNHTISILSWQGCVDLVLNRKDLLWRICRKVARFSQQANTAP